MTIQSEMKVFAWRDMLDKQNVRVEMHYTCGCGVRWAETVETKDYTQHVCCKRCGASGEVPVQAACFKLVEHTKPQPKQSPAYYKQPRGWVDRINGDTIEQIVSDTIRRYFGMSLTDWRARNNLSDHLSKLLTDAMDAAYQAGKEQADGRDAN